jgi:HK97 family phage major capsid protein
MPDPKKSLREQLKAIEASLNEARDRKKQKADEMASAQETYSKIPDLKPGSPEFEAAKQAVREHGEVAEEVAAWEQEQVAVLKMLQSEGAASAPARESDPDAPTRNAASGWDSSALLAADGMREALAAAAHSKSRFGGMEIGQVVDRDTLAADIAPTSNMRQGAFYGVLPQLQRQLRVLDLIPTGTMDQNSFPYVRESGSYNAAETAEGATKPEGAVTYTDDEAIAATIAEWLKIRRQALADVAALQTVLDGRLRYSVLRRLESQVLNGDGVGANMRGILKTTGIAAVAYDAAQLIADQILSGITTLLLADAMADGVAAHPTDWQAVLKAKASDGHYYSGGPFSNTPQTVWGVPLLASAAIPVGHALVGDFAIGATLMIREGVNVRISDSDASDFVQNRVTVLAEMRAALPVWRPGAFCDVDLSAAA